MKNSTISEVLIRPNFATGIECESMIEAFKFVESNPGTEVRHLANRTEIEGLAFGQLGFDEVRKSLAQIQARAIKEIEELYKPTQRLFVEFTLLSEMRPGDAHALHSDNEARNSTGAWGPNHTAWRDFSMMLYLNTSGVDYVGGVLCFPELGEQVIPETGMLVGFPCGHVYQHKVTPIETGARYSVSTWTTVSRDRAENVLI